MKAIYLIKIKPYSCVYVCVPCVCECDIKTERQRARECAPNEFYLYLERIFFYYLLHRRRFRHLFIDEREHFA